jgi:hypothetical protein
MGNLFALESFETKRPDEIMSACSDHNCKNRNCGLNCPCKIQNKENFSSKRTKIIKPERAQNSSFCTDDLMCQNINANKSKTDKMVLTCPNAKCVGGTCDCGSNCERDPYTGICCNSIEKIGSDTFCIENFDGSKGLYFAPY